MGSFHTLYPEEEEVIESRISQCILSRENADLLTDEGRKPWWGAEGLQIGHQYEIGISNPYLVRNCAEGTEEELMERLNNVKEEVVNEHASLLNEATLSVAGARFSVTGSGLAPCPEVLETELYCEKTCDFIFHKKRWSVVIKLHEYDRPRSTFSDAIL